MKQYGRAYYVNNKELLGMRVRQYRLLDVCKIACPLCQSIVSKVNISSHKKPKRKQLRHGNTASNYRKTVQTVRIFDGVNAEPRIVKYEIYPYGTDDPGTQDYDIEMLDDIWIKNENNKQNNSQSIQQLESDKIN
jgi:hypothetical protein